MRRFQIPAVVGLILVVVCLLPIACANGSTDDATVTTSAAHLPTAPADQSATTFETIELRFALFQPEVSPISQANIAFAKDLEARTNNRVKITIYPGGSLLNAAAMYQGIIDGLADMGNSCTIYDPGAFPFTSIAELPCEVESGWAGSGAFHDFMTKYNPPEWSKVKLLTSVSTAGSFQSVGVKGKEIRTSSDWRGVSLRSVDPEIVAAMGATAKDLPMSDVYDAISKGVINGVMGHFEQYKTWKLGEVVDWVAANPGGVQFSAMWYNCMNLKAWERLSVELQEIFQEVAKEHSPKIGLAWDGMALSGGEFLKEQGKTVYMVPDEESKEWDGRIGEVVKRRLTDLGKDGRFTTEEIDDAWRYLNERVSFWNEAQASAGVVSVKERMGELFHGMDTR